MNQDKTFLYKRKINLNLFLGLAYLVLPALGESQALYSSVAYYTTLVAIEGLILAHVFGKRVVASEAGLANLIFWKLPLWFVAWPDMEEMSEVAVSNQRQSGAEGAMEPFAALRWLAGASAGGFRVKLIVTHSEAVYLNLSAIQQGDELFDLLKSKTRLVRN